MCGRYTIVSDVVTIEKKFNISIKSDFQIEPNYNAAPGQMLPVISNEDTRQLQLFRFGYTPSWSKDGRMTINARVDNKESNPNNDMDYFERGGKPGIYQKPYWRTAIRNQRCVIIADAFYEGPEKEKLSKPYLVHMQNKQRPFAFAGIWDEFEDNNGNLIKGFAILTVPANSLLKAIGHHRSPVIIADHAITSYLQRDLSGITDLLKPYNPKLMNAYPVSPRMKSWKENDKDLVQPIGERIIKEYEHVMTENLKLEGMGDKRRRKREEDNNKPHWGKKLDS